ncbi:MAG: carboxylating nicotinate-nucleotide diphosphorylase [Phycisphaerae bacterium]
MLAFPSYDQVRPIIQLALAEDVSDIGDITSTILLNPDQQGVGTIVQKSVGVACGLPVVEMICKTADERLRVEQIPGFHFEIIEGRFSDQKTTPLVRVRGPMRALLTVERVLLNFLQQMSGMATLTNRFVRKVEGTHARIYDTRKTPPGFRLLAKYAVRAGGGQNHRVGLSDMILIKDNHLVQYTPKQLPEALRRVVAHNAGELPIEVEVDTLEQLRAVVGVEGIDVILLDNMDCPTMDQAVQIRNEAGSDVQLEASGGVTLETVRRIAETGVERIAVGALTHSAPVLDIGMDIEAS